MILPKKRDIFKADKLTVNMAKHREKGDDFSIENIVNVEKSGLSREPLPRNEYSCMS